MSVVILYLWVVTASSRLDSNAAWVPSGEYAGIQACEKAVVKLGIEKTSRCVETGFKK